MSSQGKEVKSSSDDQKKKRKSRWADVPEDEKKEIFRKRNAANLRKNRERRKMEEDQDKRIFEENECKIHHLERMVKDMEKELKKK